MTRADKAALRLTLGLGVADAGGLRSRVAAAVRRVRDGRDPAQQARTADAARQGRGDGAAAGRAADGRRADGAGARELRADRTAADRDHPLRGLLHGAAHRQSRDDGARDGVRADPGGRSRRPGRGRHVERDHRSSASSSAAWSRSLSFAFFPDAPDSAAKSAGRTVGQPRSGRLDRAARHGDRHAGVRAGAHQSVALPGRHHEDGHARAAGRRDERPRAPARNWSDRP